MLTTVTRERDVLLEDTAQLVKKQSALRIEKESMAARLAEQGTLLASRQKQLVTLSGAHQVLGEEQAAATEALRSRTSERDILSLEKARLLEEGTTNALRLEVLAEEKRELEAEVTRLDKEKSGVEKKGRALSEMLTTVTRERDVLLEDTAQLVKKQSALRIEKESMAAQLTETRQQQEGGAADIVRLRRQIVERDEKEQALAGERKVAQNVIERLEKTRTRMLQQAATLRAENAQLASDYLEAQRIQREMRKDIVGYSKKLDVAEGVQRTSVHALAARKARYAKEITALQAEQRALVDELKGQYSALQVKYDRLVRPARTFLGKHVVRIGYWKEGGIFRYSLREPGDLQARNINEQQLHRSLTALKSVYGKRLYTKILFPREAALSQKDAWRFTHQILRQYDYYSQ
jgi:chromosome segregation ATPase